MDVGVVSMGVSVSVGAVSVGVGVSVGVVRASGMGVSGEDGGGAPVA